VRGAAGAVTTRGPDQEVVVLRLSALLAALFAAGAIVIALLTDSETMSLEGMAGLVDVVVSILAIFVARKVREPANPRYHFGYAKFEPLMTTVEGVLIAAVCAGSIVYAVRDIVHADPVDNPALIVVYTLVSFAVSVAFGLYMRRVGRDTGSPLVQAESELWIIEGWLTLGVFTAFAASMVLARWRAAEYTQYVDPVVCIVLSVILLRKPWEILRDSVADLVDANPYAEHDNAVEVSARACVERFGLQGLEWVRLRKAGRRVFALVSFFVCPGTPLPETEVRRDAVITELARQIPRSTCACCSGSASRRRPLGARTGRGSARLEPARRYPTRGPARSGSGSRRYVASRRAPRPGAAPTRWTLPSTITTP
jgi:cation diffusion facilitator family transporter